MPRGARPVRKLSRLAGRLRSLVAAAVLAAACLVVQLAPSSPAVADVQTAGQDVLRTGWDQAEPGLAPSTVTGGNFGQLFASQLNGQVYAQPLVIGSTVLVSTENDWVYGLDAVTGAVRWSNNFGPAWPASTIGCGDLTPNIGNTSTGVVDPSTNTYYVTTKVNNGPDPTRPNWYLHALDVTTGAERPGWPTLIVGTPANDPNRPFQAEPVNQRPGLLLMDGAVYLAFGSQCDFGTYVGLVAGVNVTTHAISMWSDEAGASNTMAGIWQGGGGLVSDGSGRFFVSTGNGVTAPNAPGSNPPQQLSQSVVRLGVDANGAISARDFFSPANAATLDLNDTDLGAGGPAGLPQPYFGTGAIPHLMVVVGKEGRLFLLNRDNLGGKAQGPGGTDAVVQSLGPFGGLWGHPAVYGGEGGYVYYPQTFGTLLAFKYGTDGQGKPALTQAGNSTETFGYTSGSPIVTSNGGTAGSAVLWIVNVDNATGAGGRLCAYNAVPASSHLNLLRCFPIGTAAKFSTPAASSGRIYVGTRDGVLYGFGQPVTAALKLPQTDFGNVQVSGTGSATVTATAVRPVTVNAVSTSAPYAVATAPKLPVTLAAGATLRVKVNFSPTAPGSFTGALNFSVTDGGTRVTLAAGLQGTGTRPGFAGTPSTLDFTDVPVGSSKTLAGSFTNTGTANETVSSVTLPTGPFTVAGVPAAGTVVAPGQSVNVSVTYTPTAAGTNSSSLSVTGPDGTGTVQLSANAVAGVKALTITPSSLSFGSVATGASATLTLTVANTGNLNVTIMKAAPPTLPFVVHTPLAEGQVLAPGESVQVQVTFAPTAAGTFTGQYAITSDDGSGSHTVPITGTGVMPSGGHSLPSIVGAGGWVFNGSAAMSGSDLMLTPAVINQSGSAVYSTPTASDGLRAAFTVAIGGGTGADGLTFSMLNAATSTPHSLGGGGGGLGFAGLSGVAVTVDTYQGGNDPSSNFIGLSTGTVSGQLVYAATATNVPDLRAGTHALVVSVSGSAVSVSVDGTQVLSASLAMPASVLPAFTGATGGSNDRHTVRAVTITSGSTALLAPDDGWRFNGSAAISGSTVVLTPAQNGVAGSALYARPVQTDGLTASFDLSMNGGTGADGATLALLDPTSATAASLGGAGSGLGFGGLAGVAAEFVTYPQNGVSSNNFLAVATSTSGGQQTLVATNTNVPDLRSGTRAVVVRVSGSTVTISIDGTQVLNATVPSLPPTAIVGFTAATGGSNDVHAVTNVQVVAGASVVPAPPATGWQDNGSATTSGGTIQLTPATSGQAGTAVFATAVATAHLDARFTIQIGGGTGADGLSFMLLDPALTTPASLGDPGGGLGYEGLGGVAVCFVTYAHVGYPSSNFVGIATGGSNGTLAFAATSTTIPDLRTGTHTVEVRTSAGHLIVSMEGVQVLDTVVAIPANALLGFSGATGGLTDVHGVSDIAIIY